MNSLTNVAIPIQFRFCDIKSWLSPPDSSDGYSLNDRTLWSAYYDYNEPFSCECRAFGSDLGRVGASSTVAQVQTPRRCIEKPG